MKCLRTREKETKKIFSILHSGSTLEEFLCSHQFIVLKIDERLQAFIPS